MTFPLFLILAILAALAGRTVAWAIGRLTWDKFAVSTDTFSRFNARKVKKEMRRMIVGAGGAGADD